MPNFLYYSDFLIQLLRKVTNTLPGQTATGPRFEYGITRIRRRNAAYSTAMFCDYSTYFHYQISKISSAVPRAIVPIAALSRILIISEGRNNTNAVMKSEYSLKIGER